MVVCRDVCSASFDPHESINAVLIEVISLLKDVKEKISKMYHIMMTLGNMYL